jgi:hypothetical protein
VAGVILVGSRAAHLGGHLPDWRGGLMRDWDIHARRHDIELWAHHNPLAKRRGDGFITPCGAVVDFFEWDETSEALALTPLAPVSALGTPMVAIGMQAQVALKSAYINAAEHHHGKNSRDLTHWLLRSNPHDWSGAHEAVFQTMVQRAERLFNHPHPGEHPWRRP